MRFDPDAAAVDTPGAAPLPDSLWREFAAVTLAGTHASAASPVPAVSYRAQQPQDLPAKYVAPAPLQAKEFAFIHENGLFHLFYMRRYADSLGEVNLRSFGHAVSSNLRHWTELDTILAVQPGAWDSDHVWSPSMIQQGGTWYMFYTGVTLLPTTGGELQRIGVATSTDLFSWTRYDQPVWAGSNVPWVFSDTTTYAGCQFRDPFVMRDPDHPGKWLLYYVGTPNSARDQLIVGVAQNDGGLTPWSCRWR